MSSAANINIVNARITHHTSGVSLMEAAAFEDIKRSLVELHSMVNVDECVLLQTCNRIEAYIVSKDNETTPKII
jgi:glutamyl-tRNA reductase